MRAVLEFLGEMYARHDLDGLVDHVLQRLPALVRSDVTAYNEINPRRRRIVWRDSPRLETVFPGGRAIFERHMGEHPLIAHYQRSGDGSARKMSDFVTQREFHRLGLYQEFFRRLDGGEYQMVIALPAPPPLVVGISVNRDGVDFTERDRLVLNLLRPHLIQAYRTAEMVTELSGIVGTLEEGADRADLGLVVIGRGARVRFATRRARRWLARYFPEALRADRLPGALQRWLGWQEACLASTGSAAPVRMPFVAARDGGRLVVRLVSEPGRRLLLLREDLAAPAPVPLEPHGLTPRECEVVGWVGEGKTNGEIAAILGIRRRTVSKHLERVFEKLGVETRTAAAIRARELARESGPA